MTAKTTFVPQTTKSGKIITRNTDALVAKAATHKVVVTAPITAGVAEALVGSGVSGETYEVTVEIVATVTEGATRGDVVATCGCDYGIHRECAACSHTLAAMKAIVGGGRRMRVFTTPEAASRSHRPTHYTGDNIFVSF
jgi:hypothetical protein